MGSLLDLGGKGGGENRKRNLLKWAREFKEKAWERIASPGMKRIGDQSRAEGWHSIWDGEEYSNNRI